MVNNLAKQKLEAGELCLGVGLCQARTVDIAKAMKTAGFDWLFIDMEHNMMGIDIATQIAVAAQDTGITPMLRVPGHEHYHASRALDGGAQGIIAPHVDDAETAAKIVSACRYPPDGQRSMTGALPQLDFVSQPPGVAARTLNDATLVVVMVETAKAVQNADAIAATPGVDIVLIGTNDLCLDMGIAGQYAHPDIDNAYEQVAAACRNNKKHLGMGGIYDPEQMKPQIQRGARFILSGSDLPFMMKAAKAQAEAVRALR